MAGIKGMVQRRADRNTVRQRAWQSMRILRRFALADLLRTVPGAAASNLHKWLPQLARHGIIRRDGTAGAGAHTAMAWRLVRDAGPDHPVCCDRCGGALRGPCVQP